jgi:hypothetical protein
MHVVEKIELAEAAEWPLPPRLLVMGAEASPGPGALDQGRGPRGADVGRHPRDHVGACSPNQRKAAV